MTLSRRHYFRFRDDCKKTRPNFNVHFKGETLTGGELKVAKGAPYAMMMEKPHYKEFQKSVLEFLNSDAAKPVKDGGGGGAGALVLARAIAATLKKKAS
ncbi:MAG: hypothetical protein LBS00_08005 [Synergistaceae bacterium]|jgi:hypothetical protein|nr:hypothetical protein [Synergistaceae bacterium]